MAAAGGDVIGLDWRIPLDRGWERVGYDRGVQGNLEPPSCSARWTASKPGPTPSCARRRAAPATSSTSATA